MAELIKIVIDDSKLVAIIRQTRDKKPMRIVADGVEYGIHQELGTHRTAAHPFMRPAVESVRPGFAKAFKAAGSNFALAEQVVEKTARDVERLAKQNAPVDTGALRASIHVVKGERIEIEFEKLAGGKVIE